MDGGTYLAGELGPWVGFTVQVRTDPTDLGVVYVFAGEEVPAHLELAPGAFVCRAEDPSRVGMDRAEVAAKARAHAREADRKGRAHARELKRRFRPELAMTDTLEEAARRTGQVVPFRAPAPAHESPDLGEAAAAVRDATPPAGNDFFRKLGEKLLADGKF